ncbi:MAG: nucleoside permease [Bacteroidia bacterium]
MGIKLRLTIMNFLQFFVWGSYLTSFGGYMFANLHFKGEEIGLVFMTMGIASIFMPTLLGIVADRWMNAERVLGFSHIISAALLFWSVTITDPDQMFWVMLLVNMFYMPTIALNNTVSYDVLNRNGLNPQKIFPPIRVWGTIGFIAAMWSVDLLHWTLTSGQLLFAGFAGVAMGVYSLTIPACPPTGSASKKTLFSAFGLDAFVLFRNPKMLVFLLFAMFLGAALQVTNQWGVPFLDHFKADPQFADSFGVKHPNILASISQISETLFILTIPFFLTRFGIKKVMLISIIAWVLRFGLFAVGDPGSGVALLILSMVVYGMAFDFFNISGSLFVEREADKSIRASAQGLFMLMTNGIGAIIGSYGSGWIVQHYTQGQTTDWTTVWYIFAGYALVLSLIFPIAFRYKHNPADVQQVSH